MKVIILHTPFACRVGIRIYKHLQNDRSDKLVLTKTGTGGLSELAEALDDSKASYAYVRVTFAKDKESKRERFIFVKWIGKGCKIMRKAKVRCVRLSHLRFITSYIQLFHIA